LSIDTLEGYSCKVNKSSLFLCVVVVLGIENMTNMQAIIDDLASRFIINVPDEELSSIERICFQIEQAHWFYEDFLRESNTSLPSYSLKTFSHLFFQHCPLLHAWKDSHAQAYEHFLTYKFRVPVCGAIMLNPSLDKCLLVKGWTAKSGWGFPRGKINKDEPDETCAVREVFEETGFDAAGLLSPQDFVEKTIREQRVKLFVVPGVDERTSFIPQTRKEISKVEWHLISSLPRSKDARFYMVMPFVQPLIDWINKYRSRSTIQYFMPTPQKAYDERPLTPRSQFLQMVKNIPTTTAPSQTEITETISNHFDPARPLTPRSQFLQQIKHSSPVSPGFPNDTFVTRMARPLTPRSLLMQQLQEMSTDSSYQREFDDYVVYKQPLKDHSDMPAAKPRARSPRESLGEQLLNTLRPATPRRAAMNIQGQQLHLRTRSWHQPMEGQHLLDSLMNQTPRSAQTTPIIPPSMPPPPKSKTDIAASLLNMMNGKTTYDLRHERVREGRLN